MDERTILFIIINCEFTNIFSPLLEYVVLAAMF